MNWSKEEIQFVCLNPEAKTVINDKEIPNSFLIYKMLQSLWSVGQTDEEKASMYTKDNNGVGFNGVDAPFLSDVAEKSAVYQREHPNNKYGLSKGQAVSVGKCLKKYAGQLSAIALRNVKVSPASTEVMKVVNAQPNLPLAIPPVKYDPPVNVRSQVERMRMENPEGYTMDGMLDAAEAESYWTKFYGKPHEAVLSYANGD